MPEEQWRPERVWDLDRRQGAEAARPASSARLCNKDVIPWAPEPGATRGLWKEVSGQRMMQRKD